MTHASWASERAESYGRLAFLGDAVLGLALAEELFRRFPRSDIGHLTKVHGHAVSGRACVQVAVELGLPERLRAAAPESGEGISPEELISSERAMASVTEAMIGACYLALGFERSAAATVSAFEEQIELASETLLDFKSALQEELARRGTTVGYRVTRETGPPHERWFEVAAAVSDEVMGRGSGRSKKDAEQAAAAEALDRLRGQPAA
ncbi:MAG: ribonuclease III family protein [Solirubrobacterales bacterium]